MGLHADTAEQDEDDHQGQGRHEGGQAERAVDGFEFLDVHATPPVFRHPEAISRRRGTTEGNGRVRDKYASMGAQGARR
ncbi:hypothetical protein GCM10010240_16200 [Streptomyces griseoviridis]|nr:hypothetical protein GCM10010240_16200 [Streptomyces griseoviridis]